MRGKSLALLILALGCGLVASLGITQVLARRGESAAPAETVPVYVAKADIPSGAVAGDDLVKLEQWPKDHVPAGALSKKEDIQGRRARYTIFAGQPLQDPMLMHPGETDDMAIPNGLRVVAIPVGIETIQSGLVKPGSRCDVQVFVRADPSLGFGETTSKLILQDIRVFAVNDITSTQSADPRDPEKRSFAGGKTVSLLVTPDQADIVTLASSLGTIRLILRGADDKQTTKQRSMSARELLGASGASDREKEKASKDDGFGSWLAVMKKALAANGNTSRPAPVKPREPERFMVRVRSGADVTDVQLVANQDLTGLASDDGVWTPVNLPPQSKSATETRAIKPADASQAAPTSPGNPPGGSTKPQDKPLPPLKINTPPPLGG